MEIRMRRYWWFVWVKVAVLAVALFIAYRFVSSQVNDMLSPYLIDEPTEAVVEEDGEPNPVDKLMGWVERKLDVQINYEDLIFDYANEYAQKMMEESDEERNVITDSLS